MTPFKNGEELAVFLENGPVPFSMVNPSFCIGGWARQSFALNGPEYIGLEEAMQKLIPTTFKSVIESLCFPEAETGAYHATPQQAAKALRNAIAFNDPKWTEVMST